ncbi:MAG: hypothetical protein EHM14_03350 [Methanothrix sp.]|nr:MAG: hypothetical protein EHM14_03350 [Methanothrix sp.]
MVRGINISIAKKGLILAALLAFLAVAAIQPVDSAPGICPSYYGPYEPNPIGQPEYCENMMAPGVYNIRWAHGAENDRNWQYWDQLDMKANMRYVLVYDSQGELSIDESDDSGLTGYTVICGRNNGPDALVFCLEPA